MMNQSNMIMQQFMQHPMFQQAQVMSNGKSPEDIMKIAQNICNEKGINLNEAYAAFQQQMKGSM